MINRVTLIGNLGKAPEVRRLENGAVVAKFSLATNENYKDKSGEWQTDTEWHDIICWNKQAEKAESSLGKGTQVYLEGKLTHRTWQDKEGNNRKTTEVVASYFRVLSRNEVSGTSFPTNDPEQNDEGLPAHVAAESVAADDDLPF